MNDLVQWITLAFTTIGGGVGLVACLGIVFKIVRQFRDVADDVRSFVKKWKSSMPADMLSDLIRLTGKVDRLLETVADLCARFRMKKVEKTLRDLLTRDMYK